MVKRQNETWTEHRLRSDFGMTQNDWETLFSAQGRRCAICGSTSPGRKDNHWCLDHDHVTGKPRGILCQGCNMGLGNFKDNKESLLSAMDYILKLRKQTNDSEN